ncbi:MAG: hypothetical protein FJW40_24000, partial [Acidobacteria bacterium]|nr:hypothetical protein [Acidobacteriota bacterium]
KGAPVIGGNPAPGGPLAVTDDVDVFFGDPTIRGSEIIVEWSGLVPGFIGLYQINLYVPGDHIRGDRVPITIRIGNVMSPKTGPVVPAIAVD